VRVVDSHTGGEPTRVVLEGGPDLGSGTMAERARRFRAEHDSFRRALVFEPRGSEALVGALLLSPERPTSQAGVIFFDRAGVLGMCGHGTIGLVTTLAHLGRAKPGPFTLDTPAGAVRAELHTDGDVSFENVACYRTLSDVRVRLGPGEEVVGDVAWGGNWFYVVNPGPIPVRPDRIPALLALARRIRDALAEAGVRGADGEPIGHVMFNGPSVTPGASAQDFVLCPSDTYDRSPCGTGTSAQLAVLHARGQISPGDRWRQESVTGSAFDGSVAVRDGRVFPTIRGAAFVTGVTDLWFDSRDPFRDGLRT
jgi:4-hydroxyproline epimerase